ncbi:DUF447 domain-containing protein [Thermococcus indicus]|uniref:DUF447 domain-containing protein n=1 Tax=Thermococcus indicus TaxID=2586643 RepID=UPI0026ABBCF7
MRGFLEFLNEGQVYEVLLVTRSNAAPVGVVKRGNRLFFKLFGGKSAGELREHPYASLQVTNDVELIVKLALNLQMELEFEDRGRTGGYGDSPGFTDGSRSPRKSMRTIWGKHPF